MKDRNPTMLKPPRQLAPCLFMAILLALTAAPTALGEPAVAPVFTEKPMPPASPIGSLDDIPSYGEALVRMVVILAVILVALLLVARFLPRWLGKTLTTGRGGTIKVIDSLALEPRKRVYLIQVAGQYFLIGTSENGVHVLADKSLDGQQLAQALAMHNKGDAAVAPPVSSSTMRSFAAALSGKPAAKEGG
jgi:flagellar protein FliO/FliZ